jgi:hypothetical protein
MQNNIKNARKKNTPKNGVELFRFFVKHFRHGLLRPC